jgi:hypothetical protein
VRPDPRSPSGAGGWGGESPKELTKVSSLLGGNVHGGGVEGVVTETVERLELALGLKFRSHGCPMDQSQHLIQRIIATRVSIIVQMTQYSIQ